PRELNPALPRELSDLIGHLLAKEPARRPQSAAAVVERIRALEGKLQPQPSRGHFRLALACAVLVLGGGAGFLVARRVSHEPGHHAMPEVPREKAELSFPNRRSAVRIQVARGGEQVGVLEQKGGFRLSLEPGEYDLSLADTPPGLKLSAERLTL